MPGESASGVAGAEQVNADVLGWQKFTTEADANLYAGAEWGYEPAALGGVNSVKEALEDADVELAEPGDVAKAVQEELHPELSEAARAAEWAAVDQQIAREAEGPAAEHGEWVGKDGAPGLTFELRRVLLDYWDGLAGREGAQYGGEMQAAPDIQQLYDEAAEFFAKEELGLDVAAFNTRVITAVATTLKRIFDERAAEVEKQRAGEARPASTWEAAQEKVLPEGYNQELAREKLMDMRQILGRFYDENPKLKWDARGAELSGDETIAWSLALEPQRPGTLNLTMLFDQYPRREGEKAQEYVERLKWYAEPGAERPEKGEWRAEQSREFVPETEKVETVEVAESGERQGLLGRVWQKVRTRGAFRRVMRRAGEAFIRAMMLPMDEEDFEEVSEEGAEGAGAEKVAEAEVKGEADASGNEAADKSDLIVEEAPEDNGTVVEKAVADNLSETKAEQPAAELMGEFALVELGVEANQAGLEKLQAMKAECEQGAVAAAFAGEKNAQRHYEEQLELIRPALAELARKARLGEIA